MDNKAFAKQLEQRTLHFAVDIIKHSSSIPGSIEANVVRTQLTKSASSIGANYREANRGRSKADFKNKIRICESESSETVFWLEVIEKAGWIRTDTNLTLKKEAEELLSIFSSISRKLGG